MAACALGGPGAHGVVEHWDGNAWTVTMLPDVMGLDGVWGGGPSDVWAVGADGAILHH